MSQTAPVAAAAGPKPKKSVALSGVTAGNTALCTVGRTGNDLHYRGYDILDIAEQCEFEEIAHLLVHGKLPNTAELAAYKRKLISLRGIPAAVQDILETIPASTHPMDVMRTGVLGARARCCPKATTTSSRRARDIADRLMASLGSMLLYWYHFAHSGRAHRRRDRRRLHRRALPAPAARPKPSRAVGARDAHLAHPVRRARVQRLDLHRARHRRHRLGHVLRDHRRDRRAAGPKHGGANEVAFDIHRPLRHPDEAEADIVAPRRRQGRSSSASAIRSTPSPTRATRSSRRWRGACRRMRTT